MLSWQETLYGSPLSTHQATLKATIIVIVDVVAASFIGVATALTHHQTIIGSPTTPLHCCVPTLPVNLGNSIVFVNQ
jgi:hypothetical protein